MCLAHLLNLSRSFVSSLGRAHRSRRNLASDVDEDVLGWWWRRWRRLGCTTPQIVCQFSLHCFISHVSYLSLHCFISLAQLFHLSLGCTTPQPWLGQGSWRSSWAAGALQTPHPIACLPQCMLPHGTLEPVGWPLTQLVERARRRFGSEVRAIWRRREGQQHLFLFL